MYKLNDKLVKNALLESLIIVKNLTKREAKEYIKNLNIKESILNNKFSQINNNELEELYNQIKTPWLVFFMLFTPFCTHFLL